jgi:hypothetical protein
MSQLDSDPVSPHSGEFEGSGEPPAWPKVVGIISIVLSSLGLFCGGCGLVFMAFMGQFLKMAEQTLGPVPPPMLPSPALIGIGALGWLWGFLLLAAGIATVRRRPLGRTLHLVSAGGSILIAIVSTILNLQYQAAIQQWVAANPTSKWAQQQSPIGQYAGMCFGLAIGLGYPIFLLVWFGFVKRRPEDMGVRSEEPVV